MARRRVDDHQRFYDDLADQHIDRDAEREPRPARRFPVSLERQRNQARFADILGGSAAAEMAARRKAGS